MTGATDAIAFATWAGCGSVWSVVSSQNARKSCLGVTPWRGVGRSRWGVDSVDLAMNYCRVSVYMVPLKAAGIGHSTCLNLNMI